MIEQDEGHGDGDGHVLMMIKCSTWKRRKKKTKPYEDHGKCINRDFCFSDQDTIESVIIFRVDGCTIKMSSLLDNSVI